MDYQGLYEDILAIERRAEANGLDELKTLAFQFRVDLLMAHCCFVARAWL